MAKSKLTHHSDTIHNGATTLDPRYEWVKSKWLIGPNSQISKVTQSLARALILFYFRYLRRYQMNEMYILL